MGTFYRKSDVTSDANSVFDTSLSDVFSDLFDGKSLSADVFGGAEMRGYYSEFPVARPPPFGDATLIGLEQHIYMESLSLNPPKSSSPAKALGLNSLISSLSVSFFSIVSSILQY